jgi:hypothetical protein
MFRNNVDALLARADALENELEELRDLPEQVAMLEKEKRELAEKLALIEGKRESPKQVALREKENRQLAELLARIEDKSEPVDHKFSSSSRVPTGTGKEGFFPVSMLGLVMGLFQTEGSVEAIHDRSLMSGQTGASHAVQIFEWVASIGFLVMGLSLSVLILSWFVLFFYDRSLPRWIPAYWAGSSILLVVAAILGTTATTGSFPWVICVYLVYPGVVAVSLART